MTGMQTAGLRELSENEVDQVDGGGLWTVLFAVAAIFTLAKIFDQSVTVTVPLGGGDADQNAAMEEFVGTRDGLDYNAY